MRNSYCSLSQGSGTYLKHKDDMVKTGTTSKVSHFEAEPTAYPTAEAPQVLYPRLSSRLVSTFIAKAKAKH